MLPAPPSVKNQRSTAGLTWEPEVESICHRAPRDCQRSSASGTALSGRRSAHAPKALARSTSPSTKHQAITTMPGSGRASMHVSAGSARNDWLPTHQLAPPRATTTPEKSPVTVATNPANAKGHAITTSAPGPRFDEYTQVSRGATTTTMPAETSSSRPVYPPKFDDHDHRTRVGRLPYSPIVFASTASPTTVLRNSMIA